MKRLLLFPVLCLIVSFSFSQDVLNKAKDQAVTTATSGGFDIKALASGIMSKLGPSLALTALQKPKLTGAVTDFLTKKSGIINLATSDKAQYAAKMVGLNTGFMDKAKGILSATQYTSLLGLKPKTPDAANPVSQLFF